MIDLSKTIKPKSDQLNADDLIAGPLMLEITGVRVVSGDQPICIDYVGGEGRPYKPCKSMRRLLVTAWGKNGEDYIGRKIIVFNEKSVKWAGKDVGGIRISHLSNIDKDIKIMLTESRGRRSPHTIKKIETEPLNNISQEQLELFKGKLKKCKNMAELQILASELNECRFNDASKEKIGVFYTETLEEIRNSEI